MKCICDVRIRQLRLLIQVLLEVYNSWLLHTLAIFFYSCHRSGGGWECMVGVCRRRVLHSFGRLETEHVRQQYAGATEWRCGSQSCGTQLRFGTNPRHVFSPLWEKVWEYSTSTLESIVCVMLGDSLLLQILLIQFPSRPPIGWWVGNAWLGFENSGRLTHGADTLTARRTAHTWG